MRREIIQSANREHIPFAHCISVNLSPSCRPRSNQKFDLQLQVSPAVNRKVYNIQIIKTDMTTIINYHSNLAFAHSISKDLDKRSMSAGVATVFKEPFGNLKEKDTKPQLKVLPFTVY